MSGVDAGHLLNASMFAIDCSELWRNPIRTGIQRVVRELLKHWPYDRVPARAARFDPENGLVGLSEEVVRIITDQEPSVAAMAPDAIAQALWRMNTVTEPLQPDARIFIPEVFFDHHRCRYYEERQPAMLAYDFLPWLRPELFVGSFTVALMPYLRLIRSVPHVAFISERTKYEYATRITHFPTSGPVLPLGADGLRIERQCWHPRRTGYAVIGSLDTRKNQHLIVEAFTQLWRQGDRMPLTLIGRAFEGHRLEWLSNARRFPQFRWLNSASDADIANVLRTVRATIYVSEAEGFGLPPVESVAAGVPVIVVASCPSVEMLHPPGMLGLQQVTVDAIASAVLSLQNNAMLDALWRDAARARLGTWRDFAEAAAAWLQGCSPSEPQSHSGGLVAAKLDTAVTSTSNYSNHDYRPRPVRRSLK
jgi:glycosyltransferase involved in cell wall biosynthesis